MDLSPAWLSDMEMEDTKLMNYEEMSKLYDTIDSFEFTEQSSQSQHLKIKMSKAQEKCSTNISTPASSTLESFSPTCLPSSSTFTISFGDVKHKEEILHLHESLGYHEAAAEVANVPTIVRNPGQAQDHVLPERKRRDKLNQHIISLSALLPNLKKMDKATVLEDASKYIKEVQDRVKELERLSTALKRKNVQESIIVIKRSRHSTSDNEYYSFDETISRMSGSSVLVKIECHKNFCSMVKALKQMQKLGLSIISSCSIPFSKTTLLINIVAQIEGDFCMTATELVKNLQLAI